MAEPRAPGAERAACIAVLLLAVAQILTPLLPSLGIGEPIGTRSDSVRTLITPAGWAFAIWAPLYAGSLAFAVFQALPAQSGNALVARLRWPAAGAFLGNAAWAAYAEIAGLGLVSVVIIAWTLACLIIAYRRLTAWERPYAAGERWLAWLPLSALAAWLTVAATVNVAASLRFHGIEAGAAAPAIAGLVLLLAGLIGAAALRRSHGNPPFAGVFLWALAAIAAAGGRQSSLVAMAAAVAAVLVIVGAALGWRARRRSG